MSGHLVILYPADYFDHAIADDLFENEWQVVEELGIGTALFDFDTFELVCKNVDSSFAKETVVIYRGWQVPVDDYERKLFPLMQQLGTPMTLPDEYARMHSADNYIAHIGELMLPSMSLDYDDVMACPEILRDVAAELGSELFVKDGVRTVYGHTHISLTSYDNDAVDRAIAELEVIRKSRGDAFTGTFIFKPFVKISEQFRVFVVDGRIAIAIPHDGEWSGEIPDTVPTSLPSTFYTMDMGRNAETGEWFVVECGDGQVSDTDGDDRHIATLYDALLELARANR